MEFDRLARNGGLQGKHVLMYAVEAKLEALCIKMVEKGADVNAKFVSSICSLPLSIVRHHPSVASCVPQVCKCHVTDSFALVLGCFGSSAGRKFHTLFIRVAQVREA